MVTILNWRSLWRNPWCNPSAMHDKRRVRPGRMWQASLPLFGIIIVGESFDFKIVVPSALHLLIKSLGLFPYGSK
jgi:hypothetical protein